MEYTGISDDRVHLWAAMSTEVSWLMASTVELHGHRMNVWICRHSKLFGALYNYLIKHNAYH